jgi:hypothetical protein
VKSSGTFVVTEVVDWQVFRLSVAHCEPMSTAEKPNPKTERRGRKCEALLIAVLLQRNISACLYISDRCQKNLVACFETNDRCQRTLVACFEMSDRCQRNLVVC